MSNFTSPSSVRRAEVEVATLLAACIDYRQVLIRAAVMDPVSARLDELYKKYHIVLEPRSTYGERPGG